MSAPSRAPAGTPEGGRFAPGQHAETDVSLSPGTATSPAAPEHLSSAMDFDHPIRVNTDGTLSDAPGMYAPSLDGGNLDSDEWELVTGGYTQQYGYNGPIMHSSEQIGGRLAEDILAEPGVYVSLVANAEPDEDDDPDDYLEPEGWAIARLKD